MTLTPEYLVSSGSPVTVLGTSLESQRGARGWGTPRLSPSSDQVRSSGRGLCGARCLGQGGSELGSGLQKGCSLTPRCNPTPGRVSLLTRQVPTLYPHTPSRPVALGLALGSEGRSRAACRGAYGWRQLLGLEDSSRPCRQGARSLACFLAGLPARRPSRVSVAPNALAHSPLRTGCPAPEGRLVGWGWAPSSWVPVRRSHSTPLGFWRGSGF